MSLFSNFFGAPRRGGFGLMPEDLLSLAYELDAASRSPWRCPPSRQLLQQRQADAQGNKFQVCLDVQQFSPEEITVKTVGRQIVVECKHEERRDRHGSVYRHFVRKCNVPEGVRPEDVVSSLSSDGVLTITAPGEPIVLPDSNERIVPIVQTGPVQYAVRDHQVEHEPSQEEKKKLHQHHAKKEPEVILAIKYI